MLHLYVRLSRCSAIKDGAVHPGTQVTCRWVLYLHVLVTQREPDRRCKIWHTIQGLMDAGDILIGGVEVGEHVPESFFPAELASPDLGCSSLEASTDFSTMEPARSLFKRWGAVQTASRSQSCNIHFQTKRLSWQAIDCVRVTDRGRKTKRRRRK